jgi:hypothetical protein
MNGNFRLLPLIFGSSMVLYGLVHLLLGWYYADIAKREATIEGTIRHVTRDRRVPRTNTPSRWMA